VRGRASGLLHPLLHQDAALRHQTAEEELWRELAGPEELDLALQLPTAAAIVPRTPRSHVVRWRAGCRALTSEIARMVSEQVGRPVAVGGHRLPAASPEVLIPARVRNAQELAIPAQARLLHVRGVDVVDVATRTNFWRDGLQEHKQRTTRDTSQQWAIHLRIACQQRHQDANNWIPEVFRQAAVGPQRIALVQFDRLWLRQVRAGSHVAMTTAAAAWS
jgi:hypothetical protein